MNRRRIILRLVGTVLMLGWVHAVDAQTKPAGEFVWAQHVTMAPSWFDPAENGGYPLYRVGHNYTRVQFTLRA